MPVYVRKKLLLMSPESLADHGSQDEDFISDPDQMIDSLPQPFRLINKIITTVYDNAWERIRSREAAEEAKLKEVIVPVYENVEVIDQYEDCPAVAESPDGQALFLGLPDDLIVLDPVTHTPITSSHLEEGESCQRSELTSIKTVQIDVQTCLIISVSKSGFGRLHIYSSPLLLLVKDLDTEVPMGSKILEGCAFNDGEFLGLTVEGKDGDVWLDILKLPRDSWLKALEDHRCSKPAEVDVTSSQPSSQRGSPLPDGSWNVSNLTKPVQLLRITAPLTTVSAAANGALSGVNTAPTDDGMNTIGVGSKHQLTEQHLKLRRAAAEVELAAYLGCQPKSIDYQSRRSNQCTWLILNKRWKMSPVTGNEQYLVCSWSNTSYLCFYDLHSTAKDTERKPDRVVPFGADVTALSASGCGSLMAVGLSDGSVILLDEMVGLPLFVENISTYRIQFLTLPVAPKSFSTLDDLNDFAEGQVVVISGAQDGSIMALTLEYSSRQVKRVIIRQPKSDELQTMRTVKSLQNVLLIMNKEGAVSLLDFETGEPLCRVMVPEPYSINRLDLYNVLSLAASDQQLLMKATVSSKEGSVNNTALLAYKLQSFPCLDSRWRTLPEQERQCPSLLHTTPLSRRVDWLLTKHLKDSHTRQLRIRQHWESFNSSRQCNQVSA